MRHDGKKGCRFWAVLSIVVYAGGSRIVHVFSMVVRLNDKAMVNVKYLDGRNARFRRAISRDFICQNEKVVIMADSMEGV